MHRSTRPLPPRRPLSLFAAGFCLAASGALAGEHQPNIARAARGAKVFLAPAQSSDYYDSFIVYYRDDAPPGDEHSAAAKHALQRVESDLIGLGKSMGLDLRRARRMGTGGHVIALEDRKFDAAEADRFMRALADDPDVLSVEPNIRLHPAVLPNDTLLPFQWGLTEAAGGINAEPAWALASGENVMIAVVDTGRTYHPDLDLKTFPGIDMIGDAGNSRDGNGRDGDPFDQGDWNAAGECGENAPERSSTWHGTHVAGIAAALTNNSDGIAGVAFGSALQHVRVLGTCGGSTEDIADGIVWASGGTVSGVPVNPTPARVLNLSLGGLSECSTTYQTAIDSARSRGSVVIVAAGNSNVPAAQATPANCNGVVTVAANNRTGGRASYSNYGLAIDVAAPGGDGATSSSDSILSTVNLSALDPFPLPGGASYDMKDGTSMAAPFVAGIAAMMLSENPALTPTQIETILRNTARPFPTFCSGGCGTGIVDAAAAIRAASGEAITQYPISVALYGSGQGTIASAPAGINCGVAGAACSTRFNSGGSVTLTATPANGQLFAGWGGACTGTNTACTLPMNKAHDVYAAFDLPIPTLGNGIPVNNLASTGGTPRYFIFPVPAGAGQLRVEISGGTGDADLYLRRGSAPDTTTYDCRPFLVGNNEQCTIPNPAAGTWHVMLRGDPDFAGVTLRASLAATTPRIFCDGLETQACD